MLGRKINHKVSFNKLQFTGKTKFRGQRIISGDITAITSQR